MAVSETTAGWGILLAVSSVSAAVIVNGIVGNYQDGKGQAYGATSNKSSVSDAGISAAMIEPQEAAVDKIADAVTHNTPGTRTFTITNDSNIPDAYQITAVKVTVGSVTSVIFRPASGSPVPVTVGSTISPRVNPGQSIAVAVTVSTAGVAPETADDITLTVATTAGSQNGAQQDTGSAWLWIARGAELGAPPAPGAASQTPVPIVETVDGDQVAQAAPGAQVTFAVPFANVGDVPAYNVVYTDTLPAGLRIVRNGSQLESAVRSTTAVNIVQPTAQIVQTDGSLVATIARLNAGAHLTLRYAANVDNLAAPGTVITNNASLSANDVTPPTIVPAVIFVGTMNVVYEALGGASHPITDATVSLLDANSQQKAVLSAVGLGVNATNANPFITKKSGAFFFALPKPTTMESDYELDVSATGYINRRIKLAVSATAQGVVRTTMTAADNMPLALAGSFELTTKPVTVTGFSGFFGNIPMFVPQALKLTMTTDKNIASAGDRVAYAVNFGPGPQPVTAAAKVVIALPPGIVYGRGSARMEGEPAEPHIEGRTLTWSVHDLQTQRALTFDAVVVPSATVGGTVSTYAHLSTLGLSTPLGVDTAVAVTITGGALSSRRILTGRVYVDHGNGDHYIAGDPGVANVRIFLEDGESALTDADGRFSFPAARPGMHVLHLDPITLPPGLQIYHGFPVNDARSSMRLVHGIYDSALMDDVNFAVGEAKGR